MIRRRRATRVLLVVVALSTLVACMEEPSRGHTPVSETVGSVDQAAGPLVVRVASTAEPGRVPPAVVASDEALGGTGYEVRRGQTVVADGELEPVEAPAAPWAHAALADLAAIDEPGSYTVVVDGTTSSTIEVADDAYRDVLLSTLTIFDSNADGNEPSSFHRPSHLNDVRSRIANGPRKGERIDVEGGWMDAGDQLKFTVTTAYSTLMLELAGANQGDRDGILDASRIGVRWLMKARRRGVFVAQVGHTNADHNAGFRDPTVDDTSDDPRRRVRPSYVLTKESGGSDVAAAVAGALANASLRLGVVRRQRVVREAESWLAEAQRLRKVWRNCCYQQDSWRDDVAVAQASLWRATGKRSYAHAALASLERATSDGEENWLVAADSYQMSAIAAAELCGVLRPGDAPAPAAVSGPACRILRAGGAAWIYQVDDDPENSTAFGRAGYAQWASVRQSESGAIVLELAGRAGLEDAAPALLRATGWFLGANPWQLRWQAEVGDVEHPYHWVQAVGRELSGAVVGGPAPLGDINDNREDDVALGPFDTEDQTYQDLADDYVMNEVGIGYSAPAALHFALISD
ncbi:glycoside hydrolase family 9 protein [Nocardioides silvaticus]|nr:glycoside hydrolase family 9 protein [Nocardioides silvaticus]